MEKEKINLNLSSAQKKTITDAGLFFCILYNDKIMNTKIIGTLTPLSSLFSSTDSMDDRGTFSSGFVFLDWLRETNQFAWQLLPLHETQLEPGSDVKHVPSPYKSYGVGLEESF